MLQTCMYSHPVVLDVWFLVGPFVYFHISCVRTAKALARLRECVARLSLCWSPILFYSQGTWNLQTLHSPTACIGVPFHHAQGLGAFDLLVRLQWLDWACEHTLIVLGWGQIFASTHYLENKMVEFDHILHNALITTWSRLELLYPPPPPAKRSFSGVYCYVRNSVIPPFCQHLRFLLSNFDSFCPILFVFTPRLNHQTMHVW